MTESTHAAAAAVATRHSSGGLPQSRPFDMSTRVVRTKQRTAPARCISTLGFLALFASAFVVMFGLTWAYVAEAPLAFSDMNYALWLTKRSMLDACRSDDVAVFGDSRTLASTMPSVMSVPVTNFAMAGTTPIETYFSVARALRCPKPPKLVVISHVPMKFMSDIDYWHASAKFGLVEYADMRAVDAEAARLHDSEIENLRHGDQLLPALRERLFTWRFPPFYFDSIVHGFIAGRWRLNRAALRDSLVSSGHAVIGKAPSSSEVAPEGQAPTYRPSPLIDLYFSRTLALLAKHGVPVVFVTMPVNHATYVKVQPEFRDEFTAYLRAKQKQFPALQVGGPVLPCWPDNFFGDMDHFNARGAEAYSRQLDPWLRNVLAGQALGDLPGRCTTAG